MDRSTTAALAGTAPRLRRRVATLLALTVAAILAPPAAGALAASVSGTVVDDGGDPASFACVNVFASDSPGFPVALGFTEADGRYTVDGLPAGSYRIGFIPCAAPGLGSEYFDDKRDFDSADVVTLTAGEARTGVDGSLEPESTIAGTVTVEGGGPAENVCVYLYDDDYSYPSLEQKTTAADGSYSFVGLSATDYKLEFDPDCRGSTPLLREYHANRSTFAEADAVTLATGEDRVVDAALSDGGSISGTVTSAGGEAIEGACVSVLSSTFALSPATTGADGAYTVAGLVGDDYTVSFSDCGAGSWVTEWWEDSPDADGATPVAVGEDEDVTAIDASLAPVPGPTLSITGGPSGPTGDSTPTFTFNPEAGATVECSIDTGTESFGACSGPGNAHTPAAALGDGDYTFRVRATGEGESTTRTREFSVDTVGPTVDVVAGPSGATVDTTPTFGFNVDPGATVECSIDSGTPAFGGCSGPGLTHTPGALADGSYTFRVRATDHVGNSNVATRAFVVDTVPPSLSITGGPTSVTSNPRPTFTFSASGQSALTCSIDHGSAGFGSCSGPAAHQPATSLDDGTWTFRVRAVDAAGNSVTQTRSFGVDTGAPDTTITSGPSGTITTAATTVTFTSDTTGATFECKLDSGAFAPCSSPASLSGLANGSHTFSVRATDAAGNVEPSPATVSFTVAVPPPPPPPPPAGDPACDDARDALEAAEEKYEAAKAKMKKAKDKAAKKKAKAALKKAKADLQDAKAAVAAECS